MLVLGGEVDRPPDRPRGAVLVLGERLGPQARHDRQVDGVAGLELLERLAVGESQIHRSPSATSAAGLRSVTWTRTVPGSRRASVASAIQGSARMRPRAASRSAAKTFAPDGQAALGDDRVGRAALDPDHLNLGDREARRWS